LRLSGHDDPPLGLTSISRNASSAWVIRVGVCDLAVVCFTGNDVLVDTLRFAGETDPDLSAFLVGDKDRARDLLVAGDADAAREVDLTEELILVFVPVLAGDAERDGALFLPFVDAACTGGRFEGDLDLDFLSGDLSRLAGEADRDVRMAAGAGDREVLRG